MKEQIEEMRKDLIEIFDEEYENRRLITPQNTAEKMTAKGYRKQSEVIDEFVDKLKEAPIKCGLSLFGLSTKEEIEEFFNGIMLQVRDAIDSIAEKMKGGAE